MRDEWAKMTSRWISIWKVLLLAAVTLAGSVWAEATPSAEATSVPDAAAPRDDAHWSIAAGVGTTAYGAVLAMMASPGPLSAASSLPPGPSLPFGFTVERRLTPSLWLTGRVAYTSSSSDVVGPLGTFSTARLSRMQSSRWQGGLSLGVRAAFNPGALVEVGAYAELGAARSVSKTISDTEPPDPFTEVPTFTVTTGGKTVSGVMGVTAEHFFTPGLSLRLSLQMVRVAKSWTSAGTLTDGQPPPPNASGQSFDAGFAFAPAFDLRFLF